jgi:hypothetical protein
MQDQFDFTGVKFSCTVTDVRVKTAKAAVDSNAQRDGEGLG